MRMRIIMISIETRGDMEPFLAYVRGFLHDC